MSSPSPRRASIWALVAALAATAVVGARLQDPAQPTFRTDASYVRVDVYPAVDGVPVTDLRREDFEVLEDGKPQAVEAFEHVVIRGGLPQELRSEPNTIAQSNAQLENPRARAFVVFLDTNHVGVDGSHNIRQPLVNALNRLIGPEDLVGVMTPEMSAADVTFARRTTTIEGFLTRFWDWGQRGRVNQNDPRESEYQLCYPGIPTACGDDRGIADQMIARRREKMSLDAMDDLVRYLAVIRQERTAILMISEGWLLYRPDASLGRAVNTCQPPREQVGIDPRTGKLTTDRAQPGTTGGVTACEGDRMALAQLDDYTQFQTMLDVANRGNVSYYPIDPRGLPVFDTPIETQRTGLLAPGQSTLPSVAEDTAMLQRRLASLRDLAAATDGAAILNSNNLEGGLRRVTEDLSSYYLLGYYSTGKLDGKFHAIRVRVKRPGVQVRARRGYLAPTAAEAARARVALPGGALSPSPAVTASATALASALNALGGAARESRIRMSLVAGWKAIDAPAVWAVGEFGPEEGWRLGADVDLMLTAADGHTLATARARVAAGARSFRMALAPVEPATPGEYTVRVRAVPIGGAVDPVTDLVRVLLPASGSSGALLSRRGPATANREVPTADLRFRRNEQIRIEIPDTSSATPAARLLDRNGHVTPIPVAATVRTDPDGTRWISAALALAPLAVGDYVVEVATGAATAAAGGPGVVAGGAGAAGGPGGAGREVATMLIAFRVVP
jgi:VWFA-related protein